jgi:SecD/SecF fusion protein
MPTKYSGRVIVLVMVFAIAVIFIFPPQMWLRSDLPWRERTNPIPGIDMVGGVSLIYKIKAPPGNGPGPGTSNLSEQVMEALKKRVDPDGVRNLVWRPIGADELEIQMPVSSHSSDAPKKREEYAQAQAELDATNIRQSDVLSAIALPAGPGRDQKLADLSQGDPDRLTLFKSLAEMSDQLAAARAMAEPPAGSTRAAPTTQQLASAAKVLDEVGEKFDEQKDQIEYDNLTSKNLEGIIDGLKTDPAKYTAVLSDLKARYAGFPKRLAAINDFVPKYQAFAEVRSTLDDAGDLKALLKGSGVLEFHIGAYDRTDPLYQVMLNRMKPGGKGPAPQPGDEKYRWFEVDRVDQFDKPGAPPQTAEWNDKHYLLCLVTPEASMTKSAPWALERSFPSRDETGVPVVGFEFDTNGGSLFGDLTTRWQPKNGEKFELATVLDNKVITAPGINGPITGGSGVITGDFSDADLKYLINTLNAGSLPAQLEDEPISERRVGSTLGEDNLRKGLTACVFGLVVVGIFMISYYYVAGIIAFAAVCLNLIIVVAVMCGLSATFTLPSLAGMILSVGTAVDANVLIFERLREEQHRGLGLRMALRNSYDRAFSAIVDSNMTSLITSLFLYWFGSEEVKGFGLTLIIGILASLFSALFFTKTIFGILIDKFGMRHLGSFPLTFPKWDKLLKPDIDWMGLAKYFYGFSIIGITWGLILFGIYMHRKEMLDIEFSAGTSVELELTHPMPLDQVRDMIAKADPNAIPDPNVVSLGTDQTVYQVVTTGTDAQAVRREVVEVVGSNLKTQLPSRFNGVDDASAEDAIGQKVIFPVPADLHQWPGGNAPDQARDYPGGVAIQLTNLSPPISPAEIRARINRDRSQSPGAEKIDSLVVVASVPDDTPTTSALVLASNPAVSYAADREGDWRQELATPAWALVRGAVNHEASLRAISSFDASVAGDMRRDATIALTLSILVIMAYIWVRFGNLKYGTATVVALLHDTVFTLAALGFAHWLVTTPLAGPLQLEPFRINLTVVAGILTIMGYSMIDTIVVFDRIRENRGKYGHLSRKVINDAINQTLSRTLLTCGTTTVTVAFMYFMGGAGIHGFTFVLLIGILVGTYSSVAIAAPILLVNSEAERRAAQRPQPPQMASAA